MNKETIHPEMVKCPICTREGDLFASMHYKGPSCYKCGEPFCKTVGTRDHLFWWCPKCGNKEPVEYGI